MTSYRVFIIKSKTPYPIQNRYYHQGVCVMRHVLWGIIGYSVYTTAFATEAVSSATSTTSTTSTPVALATATVPSVTAPSATLTPIINTTTVNTSTLTTSNQNTEQAQPAVTQVTTEPTHQAILDATPDAVIDATTIKEAKSPTEAKSTKPKLGKSIKKQVGVIGSFFAKFKPTLNDTNATEALQTVNVVIKGAPSTLEKNINAYLAPVQVVDVEVLNDALPRLRNLCKQAAEAVGYYSAQFRFELKDEGQTLLVNVTPNLPIRITSHTINLIGANEDDFKSVLALYPLVDGDVLNQGQYDALKSALMSRANDLGYFDAYWQMHDIAIDPAKYTADIRLRFNVGQRYQFGRVRFRSVIPRAPLPVIKPVLDKLVPFKAEDLYDSSQLETLNRNLLNTRYFSTVKLNVYTPRLLPDVLLPLDKIEEESSLDSTPIASTLIATTGLKSDVIEDDPFYGFSQNEVRNFGEDILNNISDAAFEESLARKARETKLIPVDILVDTAKPNFVEVGMGYATDTGVHLRTNYRRALLNQYGHSFESTFEVSEKKQTIDARYTLPYNDPLRDTVSFLAGAKHEFDNVSNAYLQSMTLGVERNKSPINAWQRSTSLRYTFDNNQKRAMLLGYGISRIYGTGGFNEKTGFKQYYQLEAGSESLLSSTDLAILRTGWSALYSIDNDTKHQVIGRLDVGSIYAKSFTDVPDQFKFFAGGDQSVRGYDYKSLAPKDDEGNYIGGQNLAVGSLEYNYRLFPKIRAAIFADAGNAFNKKFQGEVQIGVGTGIRWMSPVGPLRLDLATGIDNTTGKAGSVRLTFFLGPTL